MAKKFGSAAAFKTSLEAHLRIRAEERPVPLSTLQLKFVMERLLARLFQAPDPSWFLKGGFAMDLRFRPKARTTKDVDLAVSHELVEASQEMGDRVYRDGPRGGDFDYRVPHSVRGS